MTGRYDIRLACQLKIVLKLQSTGAGADALAMLSVARSGHLGGCGSDNALRNATRLRSLPHTRKHFKLALLHSKTTGTASNNYKLMSLLDP